VGAGLALSLANLTHFDTWVLVPLELLVVGVSSYRRWRSRERAEATVLVWLVAGAYGVVVFLLLNVMIYGDPAAFLPGGAADAVTAVASGGSAGAPPVQVFSPKWAAGLDALSAYPVAAWRNTGTVLVLLGGAGALFAAWRWRRDPSRLIPLLLFYPLAWYTFQAALGRNWIAPNDSLVDFVNLRYGVAIIPAFAYFAAAGMPRRWLSVVALVITFAGGVYMIGDHRVAAWENSRGSQHYDEPFLKPAAEWLRERAAGKRVFFPVYQPAIDRFELRLGFDGGQLVDASDTPEYRELREHPGRLPDADVNWLVWLGNAGDPEIAPVLRTSRALLCYDEKWPNTTLPRIRIYSIDRQCGTAH
jgi:hypothetical protein